MASSKLTATVLVLLLSFTTSCALVLQRGSDELRRQQSGSDPHATRVDSSPRKSQPPWRSIVHTASHDAAVGLVDGALDAAEDPRRKARIQQLRTGMESGVKATARAAGEGLVEGLNEALPATQPVIVEVMEGVRDELGLDPYRAGRKLARGMTVGVHDGLKDLRPEIRKLLEDDVLGVFGDAFGPDLARRVREDVRPALDELDVPRLAEDVSRRSALGFSEGMAEALSDDGHLGRVIDQRMARAKQTAGEAKEAVDAWLARGLLLALVVAMTVIVVVVFRWLKERAERREAERARQAAAEDGERRERMLRLVTAAIKQAGARDRLAAFRDEIKRLAQQPDERETAAALSYFLTREGLKLDAPRA